MEEEVLVEEGIENFVDFDPTDVPPLPEGARLFSNSWEYESVEIPHFKNLIGFRVMPDLKTIMNGTLNISDVELYMASITGEATFYQKEPQEAEMANVLKNVDVYANLIIENNGSAPINELKVEHRGFNDKFKPPNIDEIKLLWDKNEIDITPNLIDVDYNMLTLDLENLKEAPTGMFDESSVIEINYPMHCIKVNKKDMLESYISYRAKTSPKSQEFEFLPKISTIGHFHKEILQLIERGKKYRENNQFDKCRSIFKDATAKCKEISSFSERVPLIEQRLEFRDSFLNKEILQLIDQGKKYLKNNQFDKCRSIFNKCLSKTDNISNEKLRGQKKEVLKNNIKEMRIRKVKNTILNLGTQFGRLQVIEIMEECGEEKKIIINTIKEMIEEKQIYAKYFESSESVVFNQQANVEEIDSLMKTFKNWEEREKGKKD